MLRTNLSTRPFYNERAVHLVLGLLAVIVVIVTVVNVTQVVGLSRRYTALSRQAEEDEGAAQEIGQRTTAVQERIDRAELTRAAAAAEEANTLIDRRTFSWSELFNRIETTMPADVMMTSVRPEIEDGLVTVSMVVLGRRVEDIDQFMEALEATGAFADMLARQEEMTDDGMYRTLLRGRYLDGQVSAGAEEVGVE